MYKAGQARRQCRENQDQLLIIPELFQLREVSLAPQLVEPMGAESNDDVVVVDVI